MVQEHVGEFFEGDHVVMRSVMLLDDLVELLLGDGVAKPLHGLDEVILGDNSWWVSVELVEGCLQNGLVHDLLLIHGGSDEFSVVDFAISKVVYLIYDFLDVFIRLMNSKQFWLILQSFI